MLQLGREAGVREPRCRVVHVALHVRGQVGHELVPAALARQEQSRAYRGRDRGARGVACRICSFSRRARRGSQEGLRRNLEEVLRDPRLDIA